MRSEDAVGIYPVMHMEQAGIRVNGEELREYGEALVGRIEELEKKIHEAAGEVFNINSPKQLGVILFEKMGMKGGRKTKTGYSTSADILEKLAGDQPIVRDILEYRQLTKLKSTYADGLAGCIAKDGRIHSKFNQTITATGKDQQYGAEPSEYSGTYGAWTADPKGLYSGGGLYFPGCGLFSD